MTITAPPFTAIRRGSTYDVSATVSGLTSDPTGATATAELVRFVTGEAVPDLAASVTVAPAGETYSLTARLDGGQLDVDVRPGSYFVRFYVTLPGGDIIAAPPGGTATVWLT